MHNWLTIRLSISIFWVVFCSNKGKPMNIKIAGIGEGVHHFEFDEAIEKIGLSEPFFGNYEIDAEFTKTRNQLILNAEINLNAKFECDRCSADYNSVIKSQYQMVYIFGNAPEDFEDSNIIYLNPEADRIDLSQEIKDYSVLAIPMKKLCKEDCKGLCRSCGKDLNEGDCGCADKEIDARWLPLQDLKKKLNINN